MEIPVKTLRSGFGLPVFGLGTWGFGEGDDTADIIAIKTALEHGMTHFDTAESYADGGTERIVGRAVKGTEREKLTIVSKVHPRHSRYTGDGIVAACEASLKRLDTDYLDLYLLHRAVPPEIPVEETVRGLERLIERGLIRQYGVSNQTKESLAQVEAAGENAVVTNQVHYSLICREPERSGLLEACQERDVLVTSYESIEQGELAKHPAPILVEVAERYGKTPVQTAINWVISQPNVIAIVKAGTTAHLEENLGAVGWEMAPEDLERLRDDYPGQRDVSDMVRLG